MALAPHDVFYIGVHINHRHWGLCHRTSQSTICFLGQLRESVLVRLLSNEPKSDTSHERCPALTQINHFKWMSCQASYNGFLVGERIPDEVGDEASGMRRIYWQSLDTQLSVTLDLGSLGKSTYECTYAIQIHPNSTPDPPRTTDSLATWKITFCRKLFVVFLVQNYR